MTDNMPHEVEEWDPDLPVVARPTDAKGRLLPDEMDERELLIEVLTNLRAIADVVEELSQSPMVKAMANGTNPIMAMMGRG